MKRLVLLPLFLAIITLAMGSLVLSPVPVLIAAPSGDNQVFLSFATQYHLEVYGDSFTN